MWLQLEQPDGAWLDLDPSLPDAAPGTTITTASGTSDELPVEAYHHVVIRMLAETLEDDEFYRSEVVKDLEEFKRRSDVILANRRSDDLDDVADKIYTRDLFGSD